MRPSGVNGMDADYRMHVVSRYKRLPALKRRLKLLAYTNVIVWVLITIVQTLPMWQSSKFFRLEGDDTDRLWLAAQAATGGAIWTFALYWAGSGGNIWRDDSLWLLRGYMVCNLIVALMDHVKAVSGICGSLWEASLHLSWAAAWAGVLLYFRRMKEGMLQGRVAVQGIEVLELALNLIGVSISGTASIVTFQYLSLRQKSKRT